MHYQNVQPAHRAEALGRVTGACCAEMMTAQYGEIESFSMI